MLHIGFGHYVNENRIISLANIHPVPHSPLNRLISENNVCSFTNGHRRKTLIITDTGQFILSSISTEALNKRLEILKNGGGS